MCLQVKKDLSEGRLPAPITTVGLLTSYVAQSALVRLQLYDETFKISIG